MIIYEKDNKLNINFENSVNESPDLQISKSGDKTEVLIDGQSDGGSGDKGPLILQFATQNPYTVTTPLADIKAAFAAGRQIYFAIERESFKALVPLHSIFFSNNNEIVSMTFLNISISHEDTSPVIAGYGKIDYDSDLGWTAELI